MTISPKSIPIRDVPFLKEVECDHVYYEHKTERSYGSTYYSRVCLTCGHEWDHACQVEW